MITESYARKFLSTLTIAAASFCFAGVAVAAPPASTAVSGLPDFTDMVEKAGPAVVNIRTTAKMRMGANGLPGGMDDEEVQEFFRRFGIPIPRTPERTPRGNGNGNGNGNGRQQQEEEVPRGVGSGFIVSADGYIMTNAHVIDGADDVYVTLTDKREFKAKVIGADKRTDVAVVKIEGGNLPRLPIGDSSKLRAGEWVIAIGSPFGLDNSVTAGIVSTKARDTGDYLRLIQSDVAVNLGNSGGPLINMRGEVVGINSQILSRSGGYMGISFAVPIDEAMVVAEQLKATGKVTRGRIGVQIGEVTKDVAESLGLARAQGAQVQRVEPGSPAEKGGVETGDIILKYNGIAIDRFSDLPRLVGKTRPGTRATVSVWRKGAMRDMQLMIVEMETEKPVRKDDGKPERAANILGLAVSNLSEAQKRELNIDSGVLIESVEGAAARAGLRQGDIVLRLNNTDIKDTAQFAALAAKLDPKKMAALLVRRGDSSQFVSIRPGAQ